MDKVSFQTVHQHAAAMPPIESGMPVERPGEMPAQSLQSFSAENRRSPVKPNGCHSHAWRRWLVLGSALLLSVWGINEMRAVLAVGEMTFVEYLVLLLFSLTFSWITVAFSGSIIGFFYVLGQRRSPPARSKIPLNGRTAVLMPTYNEAPERIFASIEAMACAVGETGEGKAFDWFVISDTTDPDIALTEEAGFHALRERIGKTVNVYYRRRRQNTARKAGNVADFCRRWGAHYDHLLVLDADSLMEAGTMLELARRMEADPDAGLIQTIPQLINGTTLMARLQQFATRVYGPVVGTGLAWWTDKEGNFWGHNAIIRTTAFMSAAGLPDLKGAPPFGGHILSHDFVEAALIRRAGWSVIIAADLGGSYEECPPSMIDLAIRDRRWCQGNLQHSRVVTAKGLHWVSRTHLLTGIMSYLSSPLWLMLIMVGLVLALQAQFIRPEYFTDEFSLFPSWPRMDAARALTLFFFTMIILFTPKVLGFISYLMNGTLRRQSGGFFRLILSFILEVILSALIAPIMMLIHSGAVMSILLGHDSGWNPQRRDDGSLPLKSLIYRHRWHMTVGIFLTVAAYFNSLVLLAWLSPAIAGMLLAVPLSMLTSSWTVGARVKKWGLLRTPDEAQRPAIRQAMDDTRVAYEEAISFSPDLVEMASNPRWYAVHLALIDRMPSRPRGQVDAVEATAAMKIREATSVSEAVSYLNQREQALVLATPELFTALSHLSQLTPANVR
ncbi:glucans biosynthesis glucosyltransferase MdoH [Neptunomonas qingdaonensis]|uniref:Glucans biosynthesis glucosyltransferase H n=1 Tax=Neptunomonas qingdaonensis TaxID=1045558 RepID=A0A1I2Q334_9GAMM|nr:glucans biosynthesis glucosyltransferase MdoH [Neptunomonas qingdaonensis]SFG22764.1 membrane glycosyltransferase [Neptunomonas qingdaonensis]